MFGRRSVLLGRGSVFVLFKADSSLEYEHDYETCMFLVCGHVLTSALGSSFFIEIKDIRNGVVFFSIVHNLAPSVPKSTLSNCLWVDNDDFVAVEYYSYVPAKEAVCLTNAEVVLTKKTFLAPFRLVDHGQVFALGLIQNKFSVASIYDFLRSANNRTVVNGVDVLTPNSRLPATQL